MKALNTIAEMVMKFGQLHILTIWKQDFSKLYITKCVSNNRVNYYGNS
ncbi:hypothetical protein [Chryseobacterium scophthalmum]